MTSEQAAMGIFAGLAVIAALWLGLCCLEWWLDDALAARKVRGVYAATKPVSEFRRMPPKGPAPGSAKR